MRENLLVVLAQNAGIPCAWLFQAVSAVQEMTAMGLAVTALSHVRLASAAEGMAFPVNLMMTAAMNSTVAAPLRNAQKRVLWLPSVCAI